jgi:glycosyltransferase involved in cell wall biosynthesis
MSLWKRIYFEKRVLPYIFKEEGMDAYISLQHISLYKGKVPQWVLIHQSLHFGDLKLQDFELKTFIKYRILMNLFTKFTINNYAGIFVQTNWVKDVIRKKYKYKGDIKVIRPEIKSILNCNENLSDSMAIKISASSTCNTIKLLYMTRAEKYKNNKRLIECVKKYNSQNKENKVVLFLSIGGIDEEDIKYLGEFDYQSILTLYKSMDCLVFPSLVETLGLPLMEAMSINLPILASDLPFAREVCGDYAKYFDPRDEKSIIMAISEFVKNYQGKIALQGGGVNQRRSNKQDCLLNCLLNKEHQNSYIDYIKHICENLNKGKNMKYR